MQQTRHFFLPRTTPLPSFTLLPALGARQVRCRVSGCAQVCSGIQGSPRGPRSSTKMLFHFLRGAPERFGFYRRLSIPRVMSLTSVEAAANFPVTSCGRCLHKASQKQHGCFFSRQGYGVAHLLIADRANPCRDMGKSNACGSTDVRLIQDTLVTQQSN